MKRPLRLLIVGAAALACSDPFSPTLENVAGTYSLARLTEVHGTAGSTNWAAAGATLTITLQTNGTTTGRLFIPGADESGADFDVDMLGTWTLTDGVVAFTQTGDSFVRDMTWRPFRNRLTGDETFGDDRIIVALTK